MKLVKTYRLAREHLKRKFMRRHFFAQSGFSADNQQPCQSRHPFAVFIARGQPQCAVHILITQFQQHAVAAVTADGLAQTLALNRVKFCQRCTRNRLRRSISQPEMPGAAAALVRQHRHAFGRAIVFDAAAQVNACRGGHFGTRFFHTYPRHGYAASFHGTRLHRQRRRSARLNQGG